MWCRCSWFRWCGWCRRCRRCCVDEIKIEFGGTCLGKALRRSFRAKVVLQMCCFCYLCCFQQTSEKKKKKPNTMWGYPKIAENQVFLHFHVFVLRKSSKNCGGAMGRLSQNSREKQVSQFLLILKIYPAVWKNNVFLNFCYFFFFQKIAAIFVVFCFGKSLKTIVALCGAMWCYPAIWTQPLFSQCLLLLLLSGSLQKQWWR